MPVSQHNAAHVADPQAVHQHPAGGDNAGEFHIHPIGFQHPADVGDKHVLGGDTHGDGHVGMLFQMAEFTVERDEVLGLDQAQHQFQLILAGVAGDVDVVHLLVNYFSPQLHQLVDHPEDALLVAGEWGWRK